MKNRDLFRRLPYVVDLPGYSVSRYSSYGSSYVVSPTHHKRSDAFVIPKYMVMGSSSLMRGCFFSKNTIGFPGENSPGSLHHRSFTSSRPKDQNAKFFLQKKENQAIFRKTKVKMSRKRPYDGSNISNFEPVEKRFLGDIPTVHQDDVTLMSFVESKQIDTAKPNGFNMGNLTESEFTKLIMKLDALHPDFQLGVIEIASQYILLPDETTYDSVLDHLYKVPEEVLQSIQQYLRRSGATYTRKFRQNEEVAFSRVRTKQFLRDRIRIIRDDGSEEIHHALPVLYDRFIIHADGEIMGRAIPVPEDPTERRLENEYDFINRTNDIFDPYNSDNDRLIKAAWAAIRPKRSSETANVDSTDDEGDLPPLPLAASPVRLLPGDETEDQKQFSFLPELSPERDFPRNESPSQSSMPASSSSSSTSSPARQSLVSPPFVPTMNQTASKDSPTSPRVRSRPVPNHRPVSQTYSPGSLSAPSHLTNFVAQPKNCSRQLSTSTLIASPVTSYVAPLHTSSLQVPSAAAPQSRPRPVPSHAPPRPAPSAVPSQTRPGPVPSAVPPHAPPRPVPSTVPSHTRPRPTPSTQTSSASTSVPFFMKTLPKHQRLGTSKPTK